MTDDERIDLLVAAGEWTARDLIRLVSEDYKAVARTIFLDPDRLERWKRYYTVACVAVALHRTGERLGKDKIPEILSATEGVLSRWDPQALAAFVEFIQTKPVREAEVRSSVDSFNAKNPPSEWISKEAVEPHATGFWIISSVFGRPVELPELPLSIELGENVHHNFGKWWEREQEFAEVNARKGNPVGAGVERGPWVLPGPPPPPPSSWRRWTPMGLLGRTRRNAYATGVAIGSTLGTVAGCAYLLAQWIIWFGGVAFLFVRTGWWAALLWLVCGPMTLALIDNVLGTIFNTIIRTQSRDNPPP